MHRSVLEDADFIAWANENVVVLVGHPKGAHKSQDVAKPAKGEPRTQCSLYPGITCEDHEKAFVDATGKEPGAPKDEKDKKESKPKAAARKKDDAKPDLPRLEVQGFPASYMVAPDGTVQKHGADRQPGSCRDALVEFQKKADENPVPWSKWAELHKALAEGEKAFKDSKWKAALAAFARADAAVGGKLPKAAAESTKARLEAVNAKAVARFEEVKKGKGDDAAKARAVQALKAEFGQAFTAGPLPVVADLDAFLSSAGAPPAAK